MKEDERTKEIEVLRLIGTDARMSIDTIAAKVGMHKTGVYNMLKKLVEENGIRFVPEIEIGNIWKYEFIAESKMKKKREIQKMEVPMLGFEEYAAMIKFGNKVPSSEKINAALGNSYIPQYVGIMSGHYNLFMYLIARDFSSASDFMLGFRNKLARYEMTLSLQPIKRTFGFFPLSNELIGQMRLQRTYKNVITSLNENARKTFTEIAEEIGTDKATISTEYKRLQDIHILERATYYMKEKGVTKLLVLSIRKIDSYLRNRDKWLLSMVKYDIDRYIYMAEITNPDGMFIIANAPSNFEFEKFKDKLIRMNLGVDITESTLHETLRGHLGFRFFDPRYTPQYEYLEQKGLVPRARLEEGNNVEDEFDVAEPL